MRSSLIGGTVLFCVATLPTPFTFATGKLETQEKTVLALKTLLDEGLTRREDLSQISRKLRQAQLTRPDDPALDYAQGLVLLSRVQPKQAVQRFESALKRRATYLPAWEALLRTRLVRKESKPLRADSLRLARLVRDESAWEDQNQRQKAAAWLGQVAGFLALPEVDLLKDQERKTFESALKQQLGNALTSAFVSGQTTLHKRHQRLKQELEKDAQQEMERQSKKADQELAELTDKSESLDQKAESLKMTADQWKTWLDERTDKADKQLKDLETEYQTIEQTAQGVSRLIQQTQVDAGRLRTSLGLRGIRGVRADQQPAMLQLGQELTKYQNQYLLLQQRASGIISRGRRVLAGRATAVRRYQQATGKIASESETLKRFKKSVEAASDQLESEDSNVQVKRSLEKRLAIPASYFDVDATAELKRLIEQAGGKTENP